MKLSALVQSVVRRENLRKLFRYGVTGGSSAAVELALFWILNEKVGWSPVIAHLAVYTVTFWMSFLLNKFWTFESRKNFLPQFFKYLCLFLFNLPVTSLLLRLLTDAGLLPILAKLIVMACVVCWNFVLYKKVIYK